MSTCHASRKVLYLKKSFKLYSRSPGGGGGGGGYGENILSANEPHSLIYFFATKLSVTLYTPRHI
jgi:hypothetical protein